MKKLNKAVSITLWLILQIFLLAMLVIQAEKTGDLTVIAILFALNAVTFGALSIAINRFKKQ